MAQTTSGPFYEDPTNKQSFIHVVLGLCLLILSWISVFCRFISRHKINSIGLDDYFIIPSLIFFSVYIAGEFKFHELVPGFMPSSISAAASSMTWLIIVEVTYSQSMIFLKLALGYFFLRLVISPIQRRCIYAVMILSTVTNLFVSFWDIGVCGNPAMYFYDVATGKCASIKAQIAVGYTQAAVNSFTDLTLSCIPFFLLKGSRMPSAMRAYVTFMLVLATAGCVASIVRFFYVHTLWDMDDFYLAVPSLGITSTIELASGIISSSLATLRPLVASLRADYVAPNMRGHTMGSGSFRHQSTHQPRVLTFQKHDHLLLLERADSKAELIECRGLGLTFGMENAADLQFEMPKEPDRVVITRDAEHMC